MSDAFDSISLKSNASFSGLSLLISLSPIFPPPLLFSQLLSSSFTPRPSPTQTHLLNCFRFPRRPPPSPPPAVSRPLWLPPQTSLPAPQDVLGVENSVSHHLYFQSPRWTQVGVAFPYRTLCARGSHSPTADAAGASIQRAERRARGTRRWWILGTREK